ncbi:DUF4270 family protein [uncultured Bacteroides sp.]|uniref:DUF4270 family protein n=1 Tax=uncultured Bacteroides sp. TaxID=162156 RepID=UPI002AA873CF|nr:DUF4270 family protein [uncultured Bacteroides sp.]
MKKILFFISLVTLLICTSCHDELSTLGNNWVESDLKNVQTDTCTVRMSTVLLDSINTSNKSVAQIGYYKDDIWGKISGSSYVEYSPSTFTPDENLSYRFDSLTISMKCNGDYVGDTLAPLKVHLYELTENLELNTSGYLYNNSNVSYQSTPFSTINIQPKPNGKNHLEYRLSDDLGKLWFNKMLSRSDDFTSSDNFRKYFKGIAFVPDESSDKSLMGFAINDSSLCINLYYHELGESATDLTVKFTPSTPNYNKVNHDRSNTPLQLLNSGTTVLASDKMSNVAYVQGLTGLYTKIEFPYLNNILEAGQMVSIESATLYLYPVKGSYGVLNPLPSSLALYQSNENNVTEDQIKDVLGSSVQTGSLITDNDLHENTYYSFNITSFLQSSLGTIGVNKKNLQLVIPEDKINSSYQSVVFGDMKHPQSQVKLSILYKVYKTN